MDTIFVFLLRNDVWILFLSALGILWYFFQLFTAQRALRRVVFSLEKEQTLRQRNNALFLVLLLGAVIAIVTVTNVYVRPLLPETLLRPPSPTPNPQTLFLGTPTPATQQLTLPSPTPEIAPTVTLRPRGAVPTPPEGNDTAQPLTTIEAQRVGCTDRVDISQPAAGSQLTGGLSIFGTASPDGFAYYDVEINGPETNERWESLLANTFNQPVTNGFLAGGDLTNWSPGVYRLRLTVYDRENAPLGQCLIRIGLNL